MPTRSFYGLALLPPWSMIGPMLPLKEMLSCIAMKPKDGSPPRQGQSVLTGQFMKTPTFQAKQSLLAEVIQPLTLTIR